ncbi:protein FAR1-RELATED SEQUENCE 5-like [Arachis hypogaea]|uniref:protein FAR1-RELATED SEQUENCE 5-like n=1 Tax=Arachis hypogaea TaxID=3818 RepID=UPI000DEC89F8|nr:protein FAR1-RELATED SEQUENCE 5-like [Arachis hypogaea]
MYNKEKSSLSSLATHSPNEPKPLTCLRIRRHASAADAAALYPIRRAASHLLNLFFLPTADSVEPCSPSKPTVITVTTASSPADSTKIQGRVVTTAIECTDINEFGSDDMDLVDELLDHSCLAEDVIPRVGMRFKHLKLAQDFYPTYAKKVGFISKIRNTNYDRMTKESINQSIHCNREGFRGSRVKTPTRKNTIAIVGCRARVYAKFDREKQDWVLLKVELRHSYPCSTKKAVHYHENRALTMHAKCIIEVNDEVDIRPNKTFLALANEVGGPSNLGFSEKDVRNYISSRLRTTNVNADVKEMLDYFVQMKEMNPNLFYVVNVDDDYKFRSAVWVDARCKASYEYYGDVVSFDTTYSTNRHGLPFASFVGVHHHSKSTLLGCALLGSEEIPNFEWVFT